jgi:hypothetical protein
VTLENEVSDLRMGPGFASLAFHGFASIPSAAISQRLLNGQIDVLRSAFARESSL